MLPNLLPNAFPGPDFSTLPELVEPLRGLSLHSLAGMASYRKGHIEPKVLARIAIQKRLKGGDA